MYLAWVVVFAVHRRIWREPSYLEQTTELSPSPLLVPLLTSICRVSITGPTENEDVVKSKLGQHRSPQRSGCPSPSVLLMTSCMAHSHPNSDRQIRSDTLPAAMISERARRHLFPVLRAQGTSLWRHSAGTPEFRVLGKARDPIRHGVYFSFKDKGFSLCAFSSLFFFFVWSDQKLRVLKWTDRTGSMNFEREPYVL